MRSPGLRLPSETVTERPSGTGAASAMMFFAKLVRWRLNGNGQRESAK